MWESLKGTLWLQILRKDYPDVFSLNLVGDSILADADTIGNLGYSRRSVRWPICYDFGYMKKP